MKNKKNVIIISMIAMIAVMIVGYAAFSASLKINGIANIESNWEILFTNIEIVNKTNGATETILPEVTGTSATFGVNLKLPGDYIEYKITVENRGTMDAIVESINASETGNDAFTFEITNIAKGDTLAKESSTTFNVKVSFDENATSIPIDPKNKLTLEITYIQDLGQNVDSEDVIINSATLTTLSGNTTLSLANSAGRKLTNYTISGNSVQSGTPTPNAPVEIQSVGNKTKNLLNPSIWEEPKTENGLTIYYNEEEDYFVINGTASTTRSYRLSYLNVPATVNGKYSFLIDYVSGKITRPNESDYALAYFGKSDTVNTNSNWSATGFYEYDSKKENVNCDKQYISAMWFYITGGVTFDNYKVRIQLEESATATEYEPYGYKIPIEVSGKNLFNKNGLTSYGYVGDVFTVDGINSAKIYQTDGDYGISIQGVFEENTQYTIKFREKYVGTRGYVKVDFIYTDGTRTKAIGEDSTSNWTTRIATSDAGKTISKIQFSNAGNGSSYAYYLDLDSFQLEKGTTATQYESYDYYNYSIFLDEPLNKIKISSYEYIDYIDFKTKNLTKTTKKIILTGNESWRLNSDYTFALSQGEIINGGYCTHYTNLTQGSQFGVDNGAYLAYTATLFVSDLNYSTVDSFKAYLNEQYRAGTPVTCVVGLMDKSVVQEIDLPRIQTSEGTSNISINLDNGISVPISVEYYKTK